MIRIMYEDFARHRHHKKLNGKPDISRILHEIAQANGFVLSEAVCDGHNCKKEASLHKLIALADDPLEVLWVWMFCDSCFGEMRRKIPLLREQSRAHADAAKRLGGSSTSRPL